MNNFLHIVFSSKSKADSEFSFLKKLWTKIGLVYKQIEIGKKALSQILVKFCEKTKIL